MEEKQISQREMTVGEYLAAFSEKSADYQLVEKNAEKIETITVTVMEREDGARWEDTSFVEKSGVKYTVRARLD